MLANVHYYSGTSWPHLQEFVVMLKHTLSSKTDICLFQPVARNLLISGWCSMLTTSVAPGVSRLCRFCPVRLSQTWIHSDSHTISKQGFLNLDGSETWPSQDTTSLSVYCQCCQLLVSVTALYLHTGPSGTNVPYSHFSSLTSTHLRLPCKQQSNGRDRQRLMCRRGVALRRISYQLIKVRYKENCTNWVCVTSVHFFSF